MNMVVNINLSFFFVRFTWCVIKENDNLRTWYLISTDDIYEREIWYVDKHKNIKIS